MRKQSHEFSKLLRPTTAPQVSAHGFFDMVLYLNQSDMKELASFRWKTYFTKEQNRLVEQSPYHASELKNLLIGCCYVCILGSKSRLGRIKERQ